MFGFAEPPGVDWGKVRAAQMAVAYRSAFGRFLMMTIGALLLFTLLYKHVEDWLLISWLSLTILSGLLSAWPHMRLGRNLPTYVTRARLRRSNALILIGASSWAAAPLLFGVVVSAETLVGLWSVMTALMAGMTVALSALPLATAGFLVMTGLSLSLTLVVYGMPIIAGVALAYMLALVASCLENGRSFLLHRMAESALTDREEVVGLLLREFDEGGGDWMWQIDASRCLTSVSKRFAAALDRNQQTMEGQPILRVLAGDSWETGSFPPSLHELSEKLRKRERFSRLLLPITLHGEQRWWELSGTPRVDDSGAITGFRGIGSDVTERHRSVDRINWMAHFDALTGLPNRAHLLESLNTAVTESTHRRGQCAFMMIDLDKFKAVNDTLGHPMGDKLLSLVAERLSALCSDNEICGRLGGDEFAVVIRDASDPSGLTRVAQTIIDRLSAPYEVDDHRLIIGASVGIATAPRDGRTAEMLMRCADLALYRSKGSGGGSFHHFDPKLHTKSEERRMAEIALYQALDNDELHLVYQPIVDVDRGVVVNCEALLRWTNADLGQVMPARLLPIAQDTRLIVPIGKWVLKAACFEALSWPSTIGVTINTCSEQLSDKGFAASVLHILLETGLPPHRLTIEVTEDGVRQAEAAGAAALAELAAHGVRLSLGDFGSEASSLAYACQAPFNTVKLHRALIAETARGTREAEAVFRAIMTLADTLDVEAIVLGVETDAQLRAARTLGCRMVQGHIFGEPLKVKDLRQLLREKQDRLAVA